MTERRSARSWWRRFADSLLAGSGQQLIIRAKRSGNYHQRDVGVDNQHFPLFTAGVP